MTERKLRPEEIEQIVDEVVDEAIEETKETKESPEVSEQETDTTENTSDEQEGKDKDEDENENEVTDSLPNNGNTDKEGAVTEIPQVENVLPEAIVPANEETDDFEDVSVPVQSDKDFVVKPDDVDYGKVFEVSVLKPLEKVASQKNLDDMVIEAIVQSMLMALYAFKEWAEQKAKNLKEAQKKTKEKRTEAIKEAMKERKTSYAKMAGYIAIKVDEFLRDNSPLFLDEKGNLIPTNKLTREQQLYYTKNKKRVAIYRKKYNFSKKLKRINGEKDGPFDLTNLTKAQQRELNFFINLYAVNHPKMHAYVEQMAAAQLHEDEYKKLGKLVNLILHQKSVQLKKMYPVKIASQPMQVRDMQNTRAA